MQHKVVRVEAEFPNETEVERLVERTAGAASFRVRFGRLGENRLTIRYADHRTLPLEFFVTEPLETLSG